MTETVGVVLAGGESTRFEGGDKALAHLGGTPLVERVVSAVEEATGAAPVVAVRDVEQEGVVADALATDARYVSDADGYTGPLAGLRAPLPAVDAPLVFVCGCDMPFVEPHAVCSLFDAVGEADAAVPVEEGVYDPLHSVVRRRPALGLSERRRERRRLRSPQRSLRREGRERRRPAALVEKRQHARRTRRPQKP